MPRKFKLPPKPRKLSSKKTNKYRDNTKANADMSLTELQFRARKKGILFAGLTKEEIIKKLNAEAKK